MDNLKYFVFILVVIVTAFTGVAGAQQRFVANLSGSQTVPANNSASRMICEAILEPSPISPSNMQLKIGAIGGDAFPQGTTISLHKGAAVGETVTPFSSGPTGSTPGSWFIATTVNAADILLLRQNRWYLQVTMPGAPNSPIRGQIKLANGTYNDYDADGRTDIQVYRTSTNTFYALSSLNGDLFQQQLGQPGDSVSLTVDFDGDGKSDFSTARYNADVLWRVRKSTTGQTEETRWGSSTLGDFFAAADYDGDGKFDLAVFRAGVWHIIESSTGNYRYENWGTSGDAPAPNDFDRDGKADLTVARSEGGQRVWYTRMSSTGATRTTIWGLSSDAFFTGRSDFDGDGAADLLVIRNVSGQRNFYVLRSSDSQLQVIPWGLSSDVVKLGDYDGDGITDPAVTRALNGQRVFYILQSTTGTVRYETFGLAGDF